MEKQLVKYDTIFTIPAEVAICPYCDSTTLCQVLEWEHNDDGTVSASDIDLICRNDHDYPMPYVYWHPIVDKVKAWLNERYDFDLVDWDKKLREWNGE